MRWPLGGYIPYSKCSRTSILDDRRSDQNSPNIITGTCEDPLPVIITCSSRSDAELLLSLQTFFDRAGTRVDPGPLIVERIALDLLTKDHAQEVTKHFRKDVAAGKWEVYGIVKGGRLGVYTEW